jgi:hypothetical protein
MADIDLTFIGEQMARVLGELREIRSELGEIRAETKQIPGIAEEVARLGVQAEDIKESLSIIEHDISGVKLRIERHTGLVKA